MVPTRPVISKSSSPYTNTLLTTRNTKLFHESCSHQHQLLVFNLNLSEAKSPQFSRTPRSILAKLNNAAVWMVLILPLICSSYNLFSKPLGTVPSAPITISITVNLMSYSFFRSLPVFSLSFIFTLTQQNGKFLFFLLINTKSGLMAETW